MEVKGLELSGDLRVFELAKQMKCAGFGATAVGQAAELYSEMLREKQTIFLSFTSNMASSGLREVFALMCRRRMCSAIITGIGSVEEDLMKSNSPFSLGTFHEDDAKLHARGTNRIGNILVENKHYAWLEKKLQPFFGQEYKKQMELGRPLAPHELIADLGSGIKDENSFLYWCLKNNIPVFCPAPSDGAFGLQAYFFRQKRKDFAIDVAGDLTRLGQLVLDADKTGGVVLGGGFAKHHLLGANILRGGLDSAIYISTGTQYDGSLSGARTNEAVSWGKLASSKRSVYVEADATIAFPLILCSVLERMR